MKKYAYHGMHLHLHTCFQAGASMEAQMYQARKLGMEYLFFTDHDSTLCRAYPPHVDFSRHRLDDVDENGVRIRFDPLGDCQLDFEGDALRVAAKGEGGALLWTRRHWHMISLLADPHLTLGVTLREGSGHVTLTFSERPPTFEPAKLSYPLRPGKNELDLLLSDEMPPELGGLDNALTGVEFHVSGGTLLVDTLRLDCLHDAAEIHRRQKELAARLGQAYGVCPFVGFEVSAAGEHKSCYSTRVPILDYTKYKHPLGERQAADYLLSHHAVFSYNHPFLHAALHKKEELSAEDIALAVRHTAADLIATRAYGACAIEIGFPEGRGKGFGLAEHLTLWDMLSAAGLFLTGVGDSDSHSAKVGWHAGNNFATWVAAEAELAFPVPEEAFLASIRAGRVFTADPMAFGGTAELTCGDLPMGAILPLTNETARKVQGYTFRADSLAAGARVRIIADGELYAECVAPGGHFAYTYELAPLHTVSFTRVEVWSKEGRCLLLTNPIYTVHTDSFAGEIPPSRIYRG